MNAPYFVVKAIDVWIKTSSLWRILSTYEHKVVMDLAFLNPTALLVFHRYVDALKSYAKRHRKSGAEMKEDEKVRIVVLTLIYHLSSYTQTDMLKIVMQWGSTLFEPKRKTVPERNEWEGIEILPVEVQFTQTNSLFNRYWYASNDNEELYQTDFTKKKWQRFWSTVKRFQSDETAKLTEIIQQHRISKPLIWLTIWWTIRKPVVNIVDDLKMDRPDWNLLKAFDGDSPLIPNKPKENNVENTEKIFQGIRLTLADLGLRGKSSVDDAISEGWKLDEATKIELKTRLVEWLD